MTTWGAHGPVVIVRCCRDWPVYTLVPMRRCGLCHEMPEPTDKTVEQYQHERKVSNDD